MGSNPPSWEKNHWTVRGNMLRGIGANIESEWFRIEGMPVMISVAGTFDATVTAYGSCALLKPSTGTGYAVAGTPLLAKADSISVDGPYEWVKVVVSDYVGGLVEDVSFLGRDRYAQN